MKSTGRYSSHAFQDSINHSSLTTRRKKLAVSRIATVVIVVIILIIATGGGYYFAIMPTNQPSSVTSQTTSSSTTQVSSSSTVTSSSPLIIYSADAYLAETNALESGFTNSTHIQMAPPKSGGSFLLAQEIAQGDPDSAFISVAKTAVQSTYLKNESSGWAVEFAADQMTIAYSNSTSQNSAAMNVINSYNAARSTNTSVAWYNFYSNLTSGSVKVGISNPNSDPAGVRGWLVLEAAGHIYANNNTNYFVNRMLSNSANVTATSAADLVAPLQAGQIQFLFIYKSAAEAQHLNLVQLPNGVNFGSVSYNSFYSQFSYTISSGVQQGSAIALWITVPKDSIDFTDSVSFVVYVVQNAQTLLKPFGLTSIAPAELYNDTSVPVPIQNLANQGSLQYGGKL